MPKVQKEKKEEYVKPANTFIGQGATFRAQRLSGSESVRIDGYFIGDVHLEGALQIGEPGYIEGNIQVSYALIAGEVKGNIMCRATIHLSSTARVHGDISTGRIIIDDGAVFCGYCKTRDDDPEIVVV